MGSCKILLSSSANTHSCRVLYPWITSLDFTASLSTCAPKTGTRTTPACNQNSSRFPLCGVSWHIMTHSLLAKVFCSRWQILYWKSNIPWQWNTLSNINFIQHNLEVTYLSVQTWAQCVLFYEGIHRHAFISFFPSAVHYCWTVCLPKT